MAFFNFDWNRKSFIKTVKSKQRKAEHRFGDKLFNYDLAKFQKD